MVELGEKNKLGETANLLQPFNMEPYLIMDRRPKMMPQKPYGHKMVCGLDMGVYEIIYVCDSLEDMQELYDRYARGEASRICWYTMPVEKSELLP